MSKILPNRIIIAAGISVIVLGLILWYFFIPSRRTVPAYHRSATALVIGAEIIDTNNNPPIFEREQLLLPTDIVKKYFDPYLIWDPSIKKVAITSIDKTVQVSTIVRMIGNTVYMPIEFLKDVYGITIEFNKKNNVVMIDYTSKGKLIGKIIKTRSRIRTAKSIHAPVVKRTKLGDGIYVFEQTNGWDKVRSEDGIVGYIQSRFIQANPAPKPISVIDRQQALENISRGKLNVVFHQITRKTPNMQQRLKTGGLDVLVPTWFSLKDANGNISSNADSDYVSWAHKKGYKVWALFSNKWNTEITSSVLRNNSIRDSIIKRISSLAMQVGIDGINVDFENMDVNDKDLFSQFIREMAPVLRENGIVISVDVGVSGGSDNYSKCYNRPELAKLADYIVLMTYDQHWQNSPESGSVAEYSWVENRLTTVLQYVDPSKVLLGVPFYIREWKEAKDSNGKIKVSQNAILAMDTAKERIAKNHAKVQWDEQSGQYYAEYQKDGATYKMWLEDERSINLKSSLALKYNLAGIAAWEEGFETQDIWSVLKKNLKGYHNYLEWIEDNKAI
jgi:spore germination protein YaaH